MFDDPNSSRNTVTTIWSVRPLPSPCRVSSYRARPSESSAPQFKVHPMHIVRCRIFKPNTPVTFRWDETFGVTALAADHCPYLGSLLPSGAHLPFIRSRHKLARP